MRGRGGTLFSCVLYERGAPFRSRRKKSARACCLWRFVWGANFTASGERPMCGGVSNVAGAFFLRARLQDDFEISLVI